MENKFFLVAFIILPIFRLSAQVVKIQPGISLSSLNWKTTSRYPFDKTIIGYSALVGIDYLNKKNFNLSTNIGVIKKGGSDNVQYTDASGNPLYIKKTTISLNYISFNTTAELKYPIAGKLIPFIGMGPRLEYLTTSSILNTYNRGEVNKFSYGILLGAGIKYNLSRIQFGLRGDYLVNFNKIVEVKAYDRTVTDRTIALNVLVGFKLK